MLEETVIAIKAQLSEAKSAALTPFIKELLATLNSEGFTFVDLIEAIAAPTTINYQSNWIPLDLEKPPNI
ncbi:MAG: hypothetical protein KI793_07040 [Rivularia sp. (in: Bacteria)]|nr:hypothetical protein [Rivularia sp. MS3]